MLTIQPGEHGSTYGGNPLGCTVAIIALKVLTSENLISCSLNLGSIFRIRSSLQSLKQSTPLRSEIRGEGLFNAVVIDESRSSQGRTVIFVCCSRLGALAKPTHSLRNVIRFSPPLVIEKAELRRAVQVIGECLSDLDGVERIPGEGVEAH